ncbi:MAG: hypothetical protein ACJ8FM_04700 [Xanthobacteraceae bacterium]
MIIGPGLNRPYVERQFNAAKHAEIARKDMRSPWISAGSPLRIRGAITIYYSSSFGRTTWLAANSAPD